MWETRISWLRLAYLAAILAIAAAQGDDCVVIYDGSIIPEEEIPFGIALPPFSDTSVPGAIVGTIQTENMLSVAVTNSNGKEEYISINNESLSSIDIILSQMFLEYEMNENSSTSFDVFLQFTCISSVVKETMPVRFSIEFSNNHNPVFEKQNNGDGYNYSLPMPFPRGVSISAAYNQILVFDVDILTSGETSITFTIENDLTDSFEVSVNEDYSVIPPNEVKKRFFADLKAKKQLDLSEGVDLIIVATDNEGDFKSTSAPIRIDVDVINSDPLPSFFDSSLYSSEILIDQMQPGLLETHQDIKLLDAPADATITSKILDAPGQDPVPANLFSVTYDQSSSTFQLNLDRVLEGDELERDVIVLQLEATAVENAFVALTIIHVDIVGSEVVTLEFDSTIYKAQVSDPPEIGVITTNQPIMFIEPLPTGDVTVELGPAPPNSGEYIDGLFDVQYMPENGEVILNLTRMPTNEELDLYEVLVMTLKATLVDDPLTTAISIIHVDLPSLIDVPAVPGTFDSILYLAQIDDATTPTELPTHQKITIIDPPVGDIDVILQKAPGETPFFDGLFSVDYIATEDSNEVILKLDRPLSSVELENEVLLLQLKATQAGNPDFAGYTIIQVNLPETEDPPPAGIPGQFDSTLYSGIIDDPEIVGEITMHQKILITEPPSANVQVRLVEAPGNLIFYPELFGVTYGAGEANEVKLSLLRPLNDAEQDNEVLVMKLVAEDTDYVVDTIIHVDIPKKISPPPSTTGNFESILYVAEIQDPEMEPGVIATHETITIFNAPSGEINVQLSQAPGGGPSFETFFEAIYVEETNSVELRLKTILSEEAQENAFLIMLLKASQDGNDEFNAETIIHIELPIPDSFICTTLFPTESPICPTCPPCLPPTTEAPSTIELINDPYIKTVDAGQTDILLFTVEAKLNGVSGSIIYDFETDDENLKNSIMIDHASGDVTLKGELAPGQYTFKVTAQLEGTEDIATGSALLNVKSMATCEDGTTCFPYALITISIDEATANDNILPGDVNPTNPDCKYSIYDQQPTFTTGWFSINEVTGALGVSDAADADDPMFGDNDAKVLLRLQVLCGLNARFGQPRLQEEMTTRQQMLVAVTLLPKNDEFPPIFLKSEIAVGYPVKALARQLLPGSITVLEATDADVGDTISYSLNSVNERFYVNPENGHMYPVDGKYNYEDAEVTVVASDSEGQRASASVQIRHINENEIATIAISGATLEDVENVLTQLNEKLPHIWGAINSAVIAEDLVDASILNSPYSKRIRIKRANKADQTGGLVMVVYALDDSDKKAKKYSVLQSLLQGVELEGGWSVSSVQTWEDAAGIEIEGGGGGGTTTDPGLEAAVITLGVLVGVLVIAIALIVYITVFRKKQQEKMKAKSGFKNRTSFSREGLPIANGKQNGNLHPDWKEEKNIDDDHDDRRKSMVTFSDEPEVIPVESERL